MLGWVVNTTPWPLYYGERYPVPTVQETAWSPGPVIMKGGMKVMSPFFFFFLRNYSQTYIEVYIYIVSTSITKLQLVFHKVFIINMLFPPLHETLCASRIKLFAEALELITQAVFQHCSQNGVLRVHPAGGQKDGSQRVLNQ
jgi:hypothetical protein